MKIWPPIENTLRLSWSEPDKSENGIRSSIVPTEGRAEVLENATRGCGPAGPSRLARWRGRGGEIK